MRNWLDERALRLAYRLIAFTRPMYDDINDDARLNGAQRYIAEVVTKRYSLASHVPGQSPSK